MSSRTSRTEPGWLATAGGALLLVVAGFAVGLLAGTLFEEPDLVLGQLAGRGERVPLVGEVEEVELAPGLGSVAAPPPSEAPPAPPVPTASAPAAPAAPPPGPRAEPIPRSGWAIQVGAFGDVTAARQLVARLDGLGMRAFVSEAESGAARWRVRVGPLASEGEARRLASRLRSDHQLPTWVMKAEGG